MQCSGLHLWAFLPISCLLTFTLPRRLVTNVHQMLFVHLPEVATAKKINGTRTANEWMRRWMFPSRRHRGLIWANKGSHQAWPPCWEWRVEGARAISSQLVTSLKISPAFCLRAERRWREWQSENKRLKRERRMLSDSWCFKTGKVTITMRPIGTMSHHLTTNLKGSHSRMSCCFFNTCNQWPATTKVG